MTRHANFQVLYAPHRIGHVQARVQVFLAGSIDMGEATQWQERLIGDLEDMPVVVYNPRRPDFDSTWKQDRSCPPFVEQVQWELDHLERADVIVYFFDPDGLAPVTLLELGLHVRHKDVVVCCPSGFWRHGNVDITTTRYGGVFVTDYDEMLERLRARIEILQELG